MAQSTSPCTDYPSGDDIEMDLHVEIEHLKQQLVDRDAHIGVVEGECVRGNARSSELERQLLTWREKYDRLYDSHKRVQKVNQNLEDKLLQMADKCTTDKSQLSRDIEVLSVRLAESNYTIENLHKENERYKNDMNLAIQLLQCKPDNFVSQKFDSLPTETQARVSSYIMSKTKSQEVLQSPTGLIPNKSNPNTPEKINAEEFEFNISASLMSKILEESVQNSISKHCDTCTCLKKSLNPFSYGESRFSISTQTNFRDESFCLNCNSDVTSSRSGLSATCNSPQQSKLITEIQDSKIVNETIEPNLILQLSNPPVVTNGNNNLIDDKFPIDNDNITDLKPVTKPIDDTTKLVSIKHKEIMEKIGENLNEMNLKHEFKIPSIEPISGHHRLCDRTKQPSLHKSDTDQSYEKSDECCKEIDLELCKPVMQSPKLVSTIKMADDLDISFAQIENSVLIPNLNEAMNNHIPKSKADLNSVENTKAFHNSSVSSNDAESKTSSSRSWKNTGSYNGSASKVHIGPGPRFCSLRMQAGSKNILLDNAQPNIAPVLYTRQTRNFDTSPLPGGPLIDEDIGIPEKKDNSLRFQGRATLGLNNLNKPGTNKLVNEEIPILDLPNEELPLSKPIEICEKPESGYKSNESAEIIDKLLFGIDNVIQGIKEPDLVIAEDNLPVPKKIIEDSKEKCTVVPENNSTNNLNVKKNFEMNGKPEIFKMERRESIHNMKVFNFDQYEKSLKSRPSGKTMPGHKVNAPHFINYGNTKLPGSAQLVLTEKKDTVTKEGVPTKNVPDINKKFVRNIGNQTLPENMPIESSNIGEWKKDNSVEKSSSSLSSDDSAAVLQKQQLIRVAEWVQKNLEMEQQIDLDNSDSCQQSVEEMHHVRNDFPRPAKVDHRSRKINSKTGHKISHHTSKHTSISKGGDNSESVTECVQLTAVTSSDVPQNDSCDKITTVSMVMSSWEPPREIPTPTLASLISPTYTTRSYTREELARMEYNVKQFLLNGTRWTSTENFTKAHRTGSKTETDL